MATKGGKRIGVIADTHGLLRPQALSALRGVELILHAGDVGSAEVLEGLRAIAPVVAVRGNNDRGSWAEALRDTEVVEVGGVCIYVLHDRNELDLDPRAAGFQVVVAGHSHRPAVERSGGVLYINPGSAGPRRFSLPVALARLEIDSARIDALIVELL